MKSNVQFELHILSHADTDVGLPVGGRLQRKVWGPAEGVYLDMRDNLMKYAKTAMPGTDSPIDAVVLAKVDDHSRAHFKRGVFLTITAHKHQKLRKWVGVQDRQKQRFVIRNIEPLTEGDGVHRLNLRVVDAGGK